MDQESRRRRRKLLVASVGVATISYVVGTGCSGRLSGETTGNLPAPPDRDSAVEDARRDVLDPGVTSGNLPAPPPPDGGDSGDGDGGDAGDSDATDDAGDSDAGNGA